MVLPARAMGHESKVSRGLRPDLSLTGEVLALQRCMIGATQP